MNAKLVLCSVANQRVLCMVSLEWNPVTPRKKLLQNTDSG